MVKTAVAMVVVAVMVVVLGEPACASLPAGNGPHRNMVIGDGEVGPEYLHHLQSDLAQLRQHPFPEIRDIRIVDGSNGPRLDMPLTGCRDSMDCHHRFANYLGLLVRMIETGKK